MGTNNNNNNNNNGHPARWARGVMPHVKKFMNTMSSHLHQNIHAAHQGRHGNTGRRARHACKHAMQAMNVNNNTNAANSVPVPLSEDDDLDQEILTSVMKQSVNDDNAQLDKEDNEYDTNDTNGSNGSNGQPSTKLKARFVCDITIPDGTTVTQGQCIEKTWRVRNDGLTVWPTNTQL